MVLWKYTLREVRSRPGRALLTLLSIVISVAAVVAVTVGKATTQEACQTMYENVAGRTALEIARQDDGFFDQQEVLDRIQRLPGVKAAVPSVQKLHVLYCNGHHVQLLVSGIDPTGKEALQNYDLAAGTTFRDRYDVMLETGLAQALGVQVGEEVKMPTLHGGTAVRRLRIAGLLSPKGTGNLNQIGVVFLPISTAEFFFAEVGKVNRISLVLDDSADENAVAGEIAQRLPEGLLVRPPIARAQLSKDTVKSVELGLMFAGAMMVGVAVIMIVNTFLMNVGERRRQLAVLRAIGTTRRQLIRAMLLEGMAMGLVGTVLGSLLGLGGAYLLTQAMGRVYSTAMPPLAITWGPFLLATVLGPGISLVAMFAPAYVAAKISPLEGMRTVVSKDGRRVSLGYVLLTLMLFVITGGLLAACISGYLPAEGTIYAGVLFTLAFLAFVPIMLGPMARLASFVLYPLLRVEGQIARRQVLRRRLRTSLTIGVLYVAVSTVISVGTTILNNVDDIHNWQSKTFQGDYFIRAFTANLGSGESPAMSESLRKDFRAVEGVADVDSLCFVKGTLRLPGAERAEQKVQVFVRDFTSEGGLPMNVKEGGDDAQVKQKLAEGQVVLGTVLANRDHLNIGDEITLETAKGPRQLRVAATTTIYLNGGLAIYMEGKTARQLLDIQGVSMYVIHTAPGTGTEVYGRLKALCDENGLMLQSFADLRRRVDSLITGVIASLWGILALGFVVGAFGIANTLTMNVLEQTRDLALLRVVAMTRWQVRKTILAQAIIIGFIGLTLGSAGGVIGSYTSNYCSGRLLGNPITFAFQPQLLGISFAIGMAVVLAAAWLPAERAARLNLLIALQYE